MFATFSSLIPAGLSFNNNKDTKEDNKERDLQVHIASPVEADDSIKRKDMAEDEVGVDEVGIRKKKEKGANETFIVVRPPPSVSNHPLNLQLQLVPPHSRDRSGSTRRSVDFGSNPTEGIPIVASVPEDQPLSRITSHRSHRSDVSMYSSGASMTSVSSLASNVSNSSGRRMIIPLYNLSAHNVMTNTILDAGTDAKVAKFHKRGMEVIGLAVLEPMEVWGTSLRDGMGSTSKETDSIRRSIGNITPDPPHTPTSSALSLSSAGDGHSPLDLTPTATNAPPNTGAKKIFGKFFKKKDSAGGHSRTPSNSPVTFILGSPRLPTSAPSASSPTPRARKTASSEGVPAILQPPILGIQPTLVSPHHPPVGRPTRYVWLVSKWLKGGQDGLLGGVMGMLNVDRIQPREPGADVEVRFEWIRGKNRRHGTQQGSVNRRASLAVSEAHTTSQTSLPGQGQTVPAGSPKPQLRKLGPGGGGRPSMDSHRSPSPRPPSARGESMTTSGESASDDSGDKGAQSKANALRPDDDGDESDPEDSETPWNCTLTICQKGHSRLPPNSRPHSLLYSVSSIDSSVDHPSAPTAPLVPLRLKVASLSPAPHHPKVVAQLKVPFPLPDIEVDRVQVRKRVITAAGTARPGSPSGRDGKPEGLILTAEEIKDVLSATALWLVVREGFGGVGKVTRKGDGWRIRG